MTSSILRFPSVPAAILTGAIGMPIFAWGWSRIAENFHGIFNIILVMIWAVVAFFLPILFSVADLRYWRKRKDEVGGILSPMISSNDFKIFYLPAWLRIAALFFSAIASTFGLKMLGISL